MIPSIVPSSFSSQQPESAGSQSPQSAPEQTPLARLASYTVRQPTDEDLDRIKAHYKEYRQQVKELSETIQTTDADKLIAFKTDLITALPELFHGNPGTLLETQISAIAPDSQDATLELTTRFQCAAEYSYWQIPYNEATQPTLFDRNVIQKIQDASKTQGSYHKVSKLQVKLPSDQEALGYAKKERWLRYKDASSLAKIPTYIGIDPRYPQLTLRNLATYKVSQTLQSSLIPETHILLYKGRLRVWLKDVQGALGSDFTEDRELSDITALLTQLAIRTDCNHLQVIDYLSGSIDRHCGNYHLTLNESGHLRITGAFDNDVSFGTKPLPNNIHPTRQYLNNWVPIGMTLPPYFDPIIRMRVIVLQTKGTLGDVERLLKSIHNGDALTAHSQYTERLTALYEAVLSDCVMGPQSFADTPTGNLDSYHTSLQDYLLADYADSNSTPNA